MRALVTGASGFIGYHVARILQANGHDVRVLVRSEAAARRLEPLGAEIVWGDLETGQGMTEAVASCDAIFHVAAHYSLNRHDKETMYKVNVAGTQHLLETAREAGVGRIVYTSSTATVGLTGDGSPADETHRVNVDEVKSDYKRTKVLAEQIVLDACKDGMDIVIVNPSTPVGWGDVKPTPTGKIVLDTISGKMPAYVETGLNMVSVEDVAIGHLLAWSKGRRGERYILGNENVTFGDLVSKIAKLAGKPAPRIRIPLWFAWTAAIVDEFIVSPVRRVPPRVPLAGVQLAKKPMYFTAAKAVKELGLPQTPIDTALRQAVQWFRDDFLKTSVEKEASW